VTAALILAHVVLIRLFGVNKPISTQETRP
jgi:hypothetical protein